MGVHRSNMIVYKCIVNESEFITDAQTESDEGGVEMLWGGTVCKVPAKYIEVGEEDIDIGGNDSAEGADEDAGVDDNKQQVIDLVHNFRYQPMEYSKKEYMTYMKAFCKKCVMYKKEHDMADQVPAFKENVQEALKAITSEWNEYCCYVNEDYDCEGSTVLCRYDANGKPFFYYFMDGFTATKY